MTTSEATVASLHSPLRMIDEMITQLCTKVRTRKSIKVKDVKDKRPVFHLTAEAASFASHCPKMLEIDTPRRNFKLTCGISVDHALSCLKLSRGCLEVLHDFSVKTREFDVKSQFSLLNYTLSWSEDDFVKNAKFFCSYPMAKILHNPLPVTPPHFYNDLVVRPLVFSGAVLRFLKNRLNSYCPKNIFLANSFLQGVKRGCHVVNDTFVRNTLLSHREQLSKRPDWELLPKDRFLRYLDMILEGLPMSVPDYMEASSSAALEVPRSKGGGRAKILEEFCDVVRLTPAKSKKAQALKDDKEWEEVHKVVQDCLPGLDTYQQIQLTDLLSESRNSPILSAPSLLRMTYDPCEGCQSWYGYHFDRAQLSYMMHSNAQDVFNLKKMMLENFDTDRLSSCPNIRAVSETVRLFGRQVKVQPIVEPLKCRVITKAPATLSFVCHPIQKLIWNHLYSLEPFRLLGQRVDSSMLERVRPKQFSSKNLKNKLKNKKQKNKQKMNVKGDYKMATDDILPTTDDEEWLVSGDYSAATDGIDLRLTKLVMEAIMKKLKLEYWQCEACRDVLYEQTLIYPYDIDSTDPESDGPRTVAKQRNGQLMGSILSFPVLCIINLITYWYALDEFEGRDHSLSELRVLVNGDDILFPASQGLYQQWQDLLPSFGFKLSIGKNYFHPQVCTVNSQCYWMRSDRFDPIGFLNVGLLTGQSKHSGRNGVRGLPCMDYYNEVVHTAYNPYRAHRRFMHYFKDEIAHITCKGEYNLFIPREYGGLGFRAPQGLDVVYTPFQKKWASFLRESIERRIARKKDPFKLCVAQMNKPKGFARPSYRTTYVWVPKSLKGELGRFFNLPRSYPFPINSQECFLNEESPQLRIKPPRKVMKQSFRRCLNRLMAMNPRSMDSSLERVDWKDFETISFYDLANPLEYQNRLLKPRFSQDFSQVPQIPSWN